MNPANTVFWLWITICPTDIADARCNTERHVCVWEECLKIIEERKPVNMIRRPM